MTIADFWVGNIYTNFINNPEVTFAKDKWPTVLEKYPHFKAYCEKFSEENKVRLEYRKKITDVQDILGYEIKDIDGKSLGKIGEHAAGKKAMLFVNVATF